MNYKAIAELLAAALGAIDAVIERIKPDDTPDPIAERAKNALTVIGAIVDTVKSGKLEELDPDVARAQLERLIAALDEADKDADAALDKKFDTSDSSGT